VGQGTRAQQIDEGEEQVGRKGRVGGIRQQREERQQEGRLVVEAAVVGRGIVRVEVQALLHWRNEESAAIRSAIDVIDLVLTSLEARDGRRHFDSASQQARQGGKDGEEEQPQRRGRAKEERLARVEGHVLRSGRSGHAHALSHSQTLAFAAWRRRRYAHLSYASVDPGLPSAAPRLFLG
jgi:hypothetical protein